jgi:hypothetical protein
VQWLLVAIPGGPGTLTLAAVNEPNTVPLPPDATADVSAPGGDHTGREAVRARLEADWLRYAEDVRWSAPRRGVSLAGRAAVLQYLAGELDAMEAPRLSELRRCDGRAQSFHEFTIRFRLVAPGIEGVHLPLGADVELERLRVLTHDADGRIAGESCIETWTWLSGR